MSSYVNRRVTHTGGDTTYVPLNRWSQPGNYSFQVITGPVDVTATLEQVNREDGDAATATFQAFEVTNSAGTSSVSTGLAAGLYKAVNLPAECLDVTSAGAADIQIMQNGSSGG